MSALTDYCKVIRDWLNRKSLSDELVTSMIRMGEETVSTQLKIKDMIQIDTATISSGRVLLPADWIELDYVRPLGFDGDLRFKPRGDFYAYKANNRGFYTISGNYLFIGDAIPLEGFGVELTYYGRVPPLNATPTWLHTLYPSLPLFSALSFAMLYGIEDERIPGLVAAMNAQIQKLNEQHLMSKASGSRLTRTRPRSYG